jgi:NhaP-type Na+/H+ or K+/H+ antiporter
MTAVSRFEIILLLMAVIVLLDMIARRFQLPRAAALILGGIGFALIPGTPDVEIDPELVLVLFLPPLLMSSAWFTSWRDFRADLRIILQLAVGAVFFTTLVVGVVAHLGDAVAALGRLFCARRHRLAAGFGGGQGRAAERAAPAAHYRAAGGREPRQRRFGPGAAALRHCGAALTGSFSATAATVSFFWVAIGGLLVGIVFAFDPSW